MIREDLLYTEDHEWVLVEDGIATIGITDFAQTQLGDIVYVEIEEDEAIEEGGVIGSIEAVKTVSDIFAPISGTVIEVNEMLEDMPDQVNNDPYGMGWIVKVQIADDSELENLMSPDEYAEHIGA